MKIMIGLLVLVHVVIVATFALAEGQENLGFTPVKFHKGLVKDTVMGGVEFKQDISSSLSEEDLKNAIVTSFAAITIDVRQYPELNKPATLTFKNVCFKNPVAFHNGEKDSSVNVKLVGLCEYEVDVEHWSEWTLHEDTFDGTHNGTTARNNGTAINLEKLGEAKLIYGFNTETNNVTDLSTNSNHGDANSPESHSSCEFGSTCLLWDNKDRIIVNGINENLNTSGKNNITFSFFAKIDDVTDFDEDWLFRSGDSLSPISISTYNSRLYIYYRNSSEDSVTTWFSLPHTTDDTWYHYGGKIDLETGVVTGFQEGSAIAEWVVNSNDYFSGDNDLLQFMNRPGYESTDGSMQCFKYWNGILKSNFSIESENSSMSCSRGMMDPPTAIWKFENYSRIQDDIAIRLDYSGDNDLDEAGTEVDQEIGDCKHGRSGCYTFPGKSNEQYFDAESEITVSNYPTVCAWVRNDEKTNDETYRIYDDCYTTGAGYTGVALGTYVLGSGTRGITYRVSNGAAGSSDVTYLNPYGLDYGNNEWHHVCMAYNGTHVSTYLDGSYIESDSQPYGVLGQSTYKPRIGERIGSSFQPMNGSIQCVQYWNKTLSDAEITQVNNSVFCDETLHTPLHTWKLEPNTAHMPSFYRPLSAYGDGSYWFDGEHGYVEAEDDDTLDFGTGDFALSAWIYPTNENPSSSQFFIAKGSAGVTGYSMSIDSLNRFRCGIQGSGGSNQNSGTTTITVNAWNHLVCVYDRDGEIIQYINGTNVENHSYLAGNDASVSSGWDFLVGAFSSTQLYYEGYMDEVQAINRTLSQAEVTDIYSTGRHFIYVPSGDYTQVFNTSDYAEPYETNVWYNLTLNGTSDYTSLQARGFNHTGGICSTPSGSYTTTTKNGNVITLDNPQLGDCMELVFTLSGDENYTDSISSFNMTSYKRVKPEAFYLNISPSPAYTNSTLLGNATYILNDTEDATELFMQYAWVVNGDAAFEENISGLQNGSVTQSVLNSDNFSKGDIVYFSVRAWNDAVFSNVNTSEIITIANSNFSVLSRNPSANNVTLRSDAVVNFSFVLDDVDNDVEINWSVNGVYITTSNSYEFDSGDYDIIDNTLTAVLSDGENQVTETWDVTLLDNYSGVEMVLPIIITLVVFGVLLIGGGSWLLTSKGVKI